MNKELFTNPLTTYNEAFTEASDLSTALSTISANRVLLNDSLLKNDQAIDKLYPKNVDGTPFTKDNDYHGNYIEYTDSKNTIQSALNDDIHSMILQQNNSYIIGMIAIITVLITTFLVTKK